MLTSLMVSVVDFGLWIRNRLFGAYPALVMRHTYDGAWRFLLAAQSTIRTERLRRSGAQPEAVHATVPVVTAISTTPQGIRGFAIELGKAAEQARSQDLDGVSVYAVSAHESSALDLALAVTQMTPVFVDFQFFRTAGDLQRAAAAALPPSVGLGDIAAYLGGETSKAAPDTSRLPLRIPMHERNQAREFLKMHALFARYVAVSLSSPPANSSLRDIMEEIRQAPSRSSTLRFILVGDAHVMQDEGIEELPHVLPLWRVGFTFIQQMAVVAECDACICGEGDIVDLIATDYDVTRHGGGGARPSVGKFLQDLCSAERPQMLAI